MFIADCGSGWTRVTQFSVHDEDGLVHLEASFKLGTITKAISGDRKQQLEWLDALSDYVATSSLAPVVIGATAGLRDALSHGDVTHEQLESFQSLIESHSTLSGRTQLHLLDGEDEARYELEAARYCANQTPELSDQQNIGLMSSGGMSSQLVFETHDLEDDEKSASDSPNGRAPIALSLPTKVKHGNALLLRHFKSASEDTDRLSSSTSSNTPLSGIALGLAEFDAQVESVLNAGTSTVLVPGSLSGTFVAIEMLGAAGNVAGIAHRLVTVAEAKAALEATLEEFRANAVAVPRQSREEWNWKNVVNASQAVVALRMLTILSPSARLYYCRSFTLGEDYVLKPCWALGWFVAHKHRRLLN